MDESSVTPQTSNKKGAGKKMRIFLTLAGVVLIIACGAGGWFYYEAWRTVRDQKVKIAELEKRIKELGDTPVGSSVASAECDGGSNYAADIGNFEVTLSDPNVIIRHLDGNFEGGPVTQLSIGRCLDDETNVVAQYPTTEVKILAHPTSNAATLRTNFEAQWGSPLTAAGTVTVDGVTAQIYTGSGLFTTKLLYFDNAGIGYQIELVDTNATSEAILSDVISDWAFTP